MTVGTDAGKLRHRIDIEYPVGTADGTGQPVPSWLPFAENVPAEIYPLSGTEYVAGGSEQAKVVARIKIRYRPGLTASMRCKHKVGVTSAGPVFDIYNIEAVLPDPESGRVYITMPVSRGVNEG